jgi:hypothetical protein
MSSLHQVPWCHRRPSFAIFIISVSRTWSILRPLDPRCKPSHPPFTTSVHHTWKPHLTFSSVVYCFGAPNTYTFTSQEILRTTQHNTTQHNTTQHNTTQHGI